MSPSFRRISLLAALCASGPGAAAEPAKAPGAAGLSVRLALSAVRLAPGEELEVSAELTNAGPRPIAILEDTAFVGTALVITAPDGSRLQYQGGLRTYSPKAGLWIGRAVRLELGGRHTLRFRAYLDAQRRLLCSALEVTGSVEPEVARNLGLPASFPARYVAPGRMFALAARGTYRLSYRVEQADSDRSWELSDGGPAGWQAMLWRGVAESPVVELEVP
jgi:hypothetical protein